MHLPHRLALLAFFASTTAFAGPAPRPGHGATAKLEPPAKRAIPTKSIGSPTEGHLVGGAHLGESSHLRIVPVYAPGDARWGVEPLVDMIDRAARSVRKQFPDAVLSVGHLSRAGGGEIDRHASHESGRDADVGFYVRNQQNKPVYADHFVAFKGDGSASSWPGAYFDDARNWAFVSAIASDASAHVTHIFVASPLRARLLAYAEKVGAPIAVRTRASELMAQPKGSLPHDDHFHVRVACPAGSDKCIEQPLVKKHRGHAALAHVTPKPHAPQPHVAAAHPAPPAAKKAPAPATPPPAAKSEDLVPSLAPMVPGLDSITIPVPLVGPRMGDGDKPTETPTPIDDPDGVLEHH